MNKRQKFLWLATISLVFPLGSSAAEDEFGFDDDTADTSLLYRNSFELGIGHSSDGNGKFGEFSDDFDDNGTFSIGGVHLEGGVENGSHQLMLNGNKNEFGSTFDVSYNRPGTFSIDLYGRDSQKVEAAGALTLYPHGNVLSLPEGFTDTGDPKNYGVRNLLVERSTHGMMITRHFGADWLVKFDYQRQDVDGEKSATGSQGFRGSGIVIEPVDYQHDEFTLGVEYAKDKLALGASFYLSDLDNGNQALVFENPNFDGIGAEQLNLPPSNEFTRIDFDGSYRLTERTMLNWLFNWSEAEQNQHFLPYALDAAFYGGDIFSPLVDSSLRGDVNRFTGRITLASRPTRQFNYKVEIAVRNRDAGHDPYLWDTLSYSGSVASQAASSHVYDKDQQTFKLEGGYRFANRTKLRLGWRREIIDRSRAEIEHLQGSLELIRSSDETEEDTLWAAYRLTPVGQVNIALRVERANRRADLSQQRIEHLHFVSEDTNGNLEAVGENTLPFYLSDLDTTLYALNVDVPLSNALVLSAGVNIVDEDYDDDFDGILGREMKAYDVALSFNANEDLQVSYYASIQIFEWDQDGTTSQNGSVSNLWRATGEDESTVFGLSFEWQVIPKKLQLSADISLSDTESEVASFDRLNNVADGLPGYGSDVTRADIEANWQLSAQTDILARYVYEDWDTQDYTWDGALIEAIAYGWQAPNEKGHALMISVRHRF